MNNKKTKMAFVYYGDNTFVEQDYDILSKHFEMRKVQFDTIRNIYDIFKAIKWADIGFSRFADVWSFFVVLFAKILNKKSAVVIGGYDVACEREINYGICTKNKLRQLMSQFVINNCTYLLPVSINLKEDCQKHLKKPRDIFVISNGFNSTKFKPQKNKKRDMILTATPGREGVIKLKGINTFLSAANDLKELEFTIVGMSNNELSSLQPLPDNVAYIGKIPQSMLIGFYQRAKVYCQLSLREGHPNSLCEAMLCGCVPVGSKCPSVRAVIGDTGFYASYNSKEETIEAIKEALKHGEKGEEAMQRIKEKYPIENREKKLLEVIRA